MIRAILFDMGGTLDGDGQHWLERFLVLYRAAGVTLPRETLRATFDEAERRANSDPIIASSDFRQMIESHVKWQLTHLGLTNSWLEDDLTADFIAPVREAVATNVRLLAELAERGFALAVVSNGCGNVEKLCADFGYTPFLSAIVDSRCVGVCKPDPGIFMHALEKLGRAPGEAMMVGDSFERDIVPAKQLGMITAWLEGAEGRDCPDPSLVDIRLRTLGDLRDVLTTSPTFA
jgi:HAD superfamily hydrolase (TIGR01509 family)